MMNNKCVVADGFRVDLVLILLRVCVCVCLSDEVSVLPSLFKYNWLA